MTPIVPTIQGKGFLRLMYIVHKEVYTSKENKTQEKTFITCAFLQMMFCNYLIIYVNYMLKNV